jgi:tetratricopeptide (TPR) repeat protein
VAAQRENDPLLEATVWLDLGVAQHLDHDLAKARTSYETALQRLRGSAIAGGDLLVEGRCVGNLGALYHDEGQLTAAARSYESAIALLEQAGEARHRANLISNLAVLEQELGHLEHAAELYTRALALLEPMRDSRLLGIALGNLGVLELERRHPERALELHERSLALLSDTEDRRSLALCLGRLAATLALVGRLGDAEAKLMRAGRLARGDDALVEEAVALDHAFVELAAARKALSLGMRGEAQRSLQLAKARIARAVRAPSYGPAVRERSDEIRSSLRILDPWLVELEQVLGAA